MREEQRFRRAICVTSGVWIAVVFPRATLSFVDGIIVAVGCLLVFAGIYLDD